MNRTPAQSLNVLAVSEDRRVLRHLTRFLTAFGYDVTQAADVTQALAGHEARTPHITILDGSSRTLVSEELVHSLVSREKQASYKFLLLERPNARTIASALEMGIDDFLAKPLVHGELLSRLRAAARALESRRRLLELSASDAVTGLHNRLGFHQTLEDHTKNLRRTSKPIGCVVLDIDFFSRLSRVFGHRASDTLRDDIASHLSTAVRSEEFLASLGGDRFGVLLTSHQEQEAVAVAQRLCDSLAEAEFRCQGQTIQVTASAGVSCARADSDVGEVYEEALQALDAAKKSGRDCVVRSGEFAEETQEWNGLAQPGRLFERTKVRDVMSHPATLLLADDTVAAAATAFGQSGVGLIPVVDQMGRLVGNVLRDQLLDEDTGRTKAGLALEANVDEIMQAASATCEEETTFAEVMDMLAECDSLIVTDEGHPTGVVTSAGISSLSTPLRTNSFPETCSVTSGAQYLCVADHRVAPN